MPFDDEKNVGEFELGQIRAKAPEVADYIQKNIVLESTEHISLATLQKLVQLIEVALSQKSMGTEPDDIQAIQKRLSTEMQKDPALAAYGQENEWEKITDVSILLACVYQYFSNYVKGLSQKERLAFNKLSIKNSQGAHRRLIFELEQSIERLGCMSFTASVLAQFVYEASSPTTVFSNPNIEIFAKKAKWEKGRLALLVQGGAESKTASIEEGLTQTASLSLLEAKEKKPKEEGPPSPLASAVSPNGFYVPSGVSGKRVMPDGRLFDDVQATYIEYVIEKYIKENGLPSEGFFPKKLFQNEDIIPAKDRCNIICTLHGGKLIYSAIYNKDGKPFVAEKGGYSEIKWACALRKNGWQALKV